MGEVLPVVLAIAADRSWRVRWSLAVKIAEVSTVMGSQVANNSLCACFESLLRDPEAEVCTVLFHQKLFPTLRLC
jgi:hypothetical protein